MKISILTLFPEVFTPVINSSILSRAQRKGLVEFEVVNLRDFALDKHKTVDDSPYGGGVGMVLKADVLSEAVLKLKTNSSRVILTAASGEKYNHKIARELSQNEHLILVCGHYEGVDERFVEKYVDQELSIGDYVLTGGEIPAMVITDSVVRLVKGVLEKVEATENESFETGHLEHPHYTRPETFEGSKVPPVLLSGDHKKIDQWRNEQAAAKTRKNRPDLFN